MALSHVSVPVLSRVAVWIFAALSMLTTSCTTPSTRTGTTALRATRLRADALVDPVIAPHAAPILSWVVEGSGFDRAQSAYRIIASTSRAEVERGRGDLWDTGRVQTGDSLHVVYEGRPARAARRVHWRVKLWDEHDREGEWSSVATFGVPLAENTWTDDLWIGLDDLPPQERVLEPDLDGASWISDRRDVHAAPAGPITLGTTFRMPDGSDIAHAELWIAADDSYSVSLNGALHQGGGNWRVAERLDLTSCVHSGANTLRVRVVNASPGPVGLLACLRITSTDGTTWRVPTRDGWTVGRSDDERWMIAGEDEPPAFVVSARDSAIWRDAITAPPWLSLEPVRYLRTRFRCDGDIERATLFITALGLADAYLNGTRVTTRFLPGWTHYEKRVPVHAFDVTDRIVAGENGFGLTLADGWFSGFLAWVGHHVWGRQRRVAAQLVLERRDGSTRVIRTGGDWHGSTGSIRSSDMLMGEFYDDTITRTDGFSTAGFDDSTWAPVSIGLDEVHPVVEPSRTVRIDAFHEFRPVSITEPEPGRFIFDLGRNFAGVARLRLDGERGQRITIRYGERLQPDGTLYTANLRSARATDIYVCRGGPVDWEPRTTFHGFQFVEVTGLAKPPTRETITGIAIGSLTPKIGSFACSNAMLEQLASNVYWTQRANFLSVPTDCPQRNERLGWMGDAQVYVRTAGLWCDVQAFFDKWLVDVMDAQGADGNPSKVSPRIPGQEDGGPAWADAVTICPWAIFEMYDDRRLLARQYESMKAFVDFTTRRSTPDRRPPAQFHAFGDWLDVSDPTPREVIYMAYWAESTRIVAATAEQLGKRDDAERYSQLREEIIAAFDREFVSDDGTVRGDSQTAGVLALRYGLVRGDRRDRVARRLIDHLRDRGWHLSTGFIGTKDLMLVLERIGRTDIAYRLALQEDYPSWGFEIRNGATSIWERWDGWTPERGFQDPGMNSFSHYSFGAVYQWMVETIGGIQLIEPGYREFRIAPRPGGGLTHATVAIDTVRGLIESHWEIEGDTLSMRVTVPANTRCTIVVPVRHPRHLVLDGEPVETEAMPHLVTGSGVHRISVTGTVEVVPPEALP
ncbi:MAG: family 78 glycoside hydrolase catalytic domain [Planctomycetes bacterium]|nr:family 78 glycoside hydrolase catalytic domain [Planctomycetota bacterium]